MACVSIATLFIKKGVGRPRPNYAALVEVVAQSPALAAGSAGALGGHPRTSFPSAHSSHAMAAFGFFALVVWGDAARRVGPLWARNLAGMVALLSMACAIWVGMTRIQDYWHHPDDVFAGWALGALCAKIGYAAQSTAAHDEPAAAGSDVQLLMSPMHKV
ncbi:phosphatidic acid phosphatase type 2/haloperoxidase [Tribonema minus]|uniref:Phosphatidic acid phosphatase type 2/haloperoxidase n=1 Tax=Tribonema minus TaxID=303371 RepID=A0A835ZFV7_9STRA|nr:phosphatidic acid phosphatase type 2/haloperoxidase [Tribonema minus]